MNSQPQPNICFKNFVIHKNQKIQEGGYGAIFHATLSKTSSKSKDGDQHVAASYVAKVIPDISRKPFFLEQSLARQAGNADSAGTPPYGPTIYASHYCEKTRRGTLIMDRWDGDMDGKPFTSLDEVHTLLKQVCAMHDDGVFHHDLYSRNVLFKKFQDDEDDSDDDDDRRWRRRNEKDLGSSCKEKADAAAAAALVLPQKQQRQFCISDFGLSIPVAAPNRRRPTDADQEAGGGLPKLLRAADFVTLIYGSYDRKRKCLRGGLEPKSLKHHPAQYLLLQIRMFTMDEWMQAIRWRVINTVRWNPPSSLPRPSSSQQYACFGKDDRSSWVASTQPRRGKLIFTLPVDDIVARNSNSSIAESGDYRPVLLPHVDCESFYKTLFRIIDVDLLQKRYHMVLCQLFDRIVFVPGCSERQIRVLEHDILHGVFWGGNKEKQRGEEREHTSV